MTKTCTKCGVEKDVSEFHKHKRSKDGLRSECKPCHTAEVNAWQRANRDKVNASHRRRREIPEVRAKHRAENLAYMKAKYAENPEPFKASARERQAANPEKRLESLRRYRATEAGRLAHVEGQARRNMKTRGVDAEKIPSEYLMRLFSVFDNKCAYCEATGRLTLDHFVALSKGGKHKIGNLVPACKSCNSSKHNADPFEWMERRRVDSDLVVANLLEARI